MTKSAITLIKGDKIGVETDYRDFLPVNMYAVNRQILGASGYMLCYPGLTSLTTGSGIDRGAVYNERAIKHYRVSGTKLISVDIDGTVTELGTVPGSGQAAMPYSFNTQAVVADGNMFLYDSVGGFVQVTDPNIGSPIDCVWIDGYYFLTDGESLYHTELSDETAINALSYATAEFMPDPTLGLAKTSDNKVIVFGRYSCEYFVDVATEDFAFKRVESRAQKIGIVATHAKCEVAGNWFICGGRKEEAVAVHMITVGSAKKVSTREIDKIISQYTETELSDIRMESRQHDDIGFVLLHLPDETFCFNTNIAASVGVEYAWTQLKTGLTGAANYQAINGIFEPGTAKWVYGDKQNSTIGIIDDTIFDQYGERQEFEFVTPFINIESMSINEIEIETIPGHTAYSDATVAISMTQDGLTYSGEWWADYGQTNKYGTRFIARRLGYVRDWVGFKFRGATKSRVAFGLFTMDYS